MNTNVEVVENQLMTVPLRYRGLTFDNFKISNEKQKIICDLVEMFVDTFSERSQDGSSLIFSGNSGTGKTMLAMIIYQSLIQVNYSVCYESAYPFLEKLKINEWRLNFNYKNILEIYKKSSLLILDNLIEGIGFEDLSNREHQLLFSVIDERYNNKLSTILITNHNNENLTKIIGEACMGRILEKGITLNFGWDSYRQIKGN